MAPSGAVWSRTGFVQSGSPRTGTRGSPWNRAWVLQFDTPGTGRVTGGAKRAATEALLAAGGTLTHHHAVGADHRPWLAREVGPLGVDVLRAVKRQLDPQGICNPGVLLPD